MLRFQEEAAQRSLIAHSNNLFSNFNIQVHGWYIQHGHVNNETETIVASDKWNCSYKSKYFVPGFDSSMLIEGEYENGDVEEFTAITKKIMDPREIHLHFLLHLN